MNNQYLRVYPTPMAWNVRTRQCAVAKAAPMLRGRLLPCAHLREAFLNQSTRGNSMQRRKFLKRLALCVAVATGGVAGAPQALAADTIKVGVLHSLSGTMAISE